MGSLIPLNDLFVLSDSYFKITLLSLYRENLFHIRKPFLMRPLLSIIQSSSILLPTFIKLFCSLHAAKLERKNGKNGNFQI